MPIGIFWSSISANDLDDKTHLGIDGVTFFDIF